MEEVAKIIGPFEKQLKLNAAKFPYVLSWKLDLESINMLKNGSR